MRSKFSVNKRSRGFTLIEIMVATVIMVIMVGLVIQITSEVLNVWNRSTGRLAANAEARIALDIIASDLENVVLRNNGEQWLRVDATQNVSNLVGTVGQTVGLKMFSRSADAPAAAGSINGVGYSLAYSEPYATASASERTFILFRDLEDSQTTFNTLIGPGSSTSQSALTSGFWSNTSIVDPDNYLVGNVVDFRILIWGLVAGVEDVINDPSDNGLLVDYAYGGLGGQTTTPLYADIELVVVSDEGLRILELPNLNGTGFSTVDEVVRVHGQSFSRRVFFNSTLF